MTSLLNAITIQGTFTLPDNAAKQVNVILTCAKQHQNVFNK